MNDVITPEIIQKIETKIAEVMGLFRKRFHSADLTETPKYSFRQMGRRGGLAYYKENRIELNPDFFKNHAEEMINQTVPHEVAHLVAFKVYSLLGKGHGRFWKLVMGALYPLGVKVSRCHQYDLEGVKVRIVARPFSYHCGCMDHNITKNIHAKIQSGRKYTCNRCRQPIKLIESIQPIAA